MSFSFASTFQVSKAAADLMAYCDAHIREDPLIMPVPASENPFREKKFFCSILWWPAGRAVRVQAWRCLASLSSPHLKLLAIGVELSFARWTHCCWSALSWWLKVLGESATKLATQWAYHVLLNRFVIALLLENSLAQCLMRWEMFFFFFSLIVLDLNMPQETEICPVSTAFLNVYFPSLYLNKKALIFVLYYLT